MFERRPAFCQTRWKEVSQLPNVVFEAEFEFCKTNQVDGANRLIESILKDGFPGLQIITQFAERVVDDEGVSDAVKGKICARIAEADKALVDGADESLQLMAIVSTACVAMKA